jgi:hypothetical protein
MLLLEKERVKNIAETDLVSEIIIIIKNSFIYFSRGRP